MNVRSEWQEQLQNLKDSTNEADSIMRRAIIVTALSVIFTLFSLFLHISLSPRHILSFLYLVFSAILGGQTLLDTYRNDPENRLAPLPYLPAIFWFFSFSYFALFYIGFGPAMGFRSVMDAVFLICLMVPVYALLTTGILDRIFSSGAIPAERALLIATLAALVSIIIVWYFSMLMFHKIEARIGLTEELCLNAYGAPALFWTVLGCI